jgi:hypothetical protein
LLLFRDIPVYERLKMLSMNIDNIQCSKGRITTLCKTIINKKFKRWKPAVQASSWKEDKPNRKHIPTKYECN